MKLAIPRERQQHERRVAATPDTVKKLILLGFEVVVEKDAGLMSNIPDDHYSAVGAAITPDAEATYKDADIIFKVGRPLRANEGVIDEISLIEPGAMLMAILSPFGDRAAVEAYAKGNITAFAMEFMPRITRAQSMDVLSSQSNLAGYTAVIDAASEFARAFPMMMTAAGTVAPAKVLVMGTGVAGLQAIATAKRLGAVVSATDVRAAAREQVESLAAKFVMVESEETGEAAGGYAKEMSDDYKEKQAALIAKTLAKQDIAITTALIPGRPAPTLITREMIRSMKPGSVIIDLAVESGGNCELSQPDKIIVENGVKIVGYCNVPSRVAADASALYSRNLLNFITPLVDNDTKKLAIDWQDEIITGTLLTRDGAIVHQRLAENSEKRGGN
ncbi:MAG: Re/Si-specific NAD(P)(+) transhydrogenase subunit alpha [Alphaproteobacteria bacterium]|nr:Re/Si-specific NAD(P)(+) transhydrogenase subunit alpha [Alphaproteobacteria bacterium]